MSTDRPRRVLVADDDSSIRHAVNLKLTNAGLDVVLASDGEEALRLALETEPEAFILDVTMPYFTGYEVARQLREQPTFARTPVIILTAMEQDVDPAFAQLVQDVRFMTKPFSPRELLAAVQQALTTVPR
ncbi:MAG: response regulator [Planctomycetes bacterium]|nr:response regulator [Planctomycetota bacterium]MCC7173456.1 response regulator [Planctomycetota bacterium]